MDAESRAALLRSVKKDDVKAFGTMVDSDLFATAFGRFPLLSLLYLYDAKRIVKAYLPELVKERPCIKEEPFRESEILFAERAGKALRHFVDREVSPLEMLAVLGKRRALVKLYAIYPNASRYLTALHKVYYTRVGEGVGVKGDTLLLPAEPLSYGERRWRKILALITLSAGVLILAVTAFLSVWFGLGDDRVYYKARSGGGLLTALEQGDCVILKEDLTLSAGVASYDAKIEGDRHVVRLKAPFAEKFSGEMQNVIFLLEEDFKGDAVVLENSGKIRNVSVVAEGRTLAKGGEFTGLLTAVNTGVVEGCTAVTTLTLSGEEGGDCYFGPFAGENRGTIHNCRADGAISSTAIDIGGIAGRNAKSGVITDCSVVATLTEQTTLKGWNPNVAGVTAYNEGAIYGCVVTGKVLATLNTEAPAEGENVASAYAAGVACVNVGNVESCVIEAEISASATNGAVFSGGAVSMNASAEVEGETLIGRVVKCDGRGAVYATSNGYNAFAGGVVAQNGQENEVDRCAGRAAVRATSLKESLYDFTGGIVARNYGVVKSSFFTGTLSAYDEDSLVGAICGLTYLYGSFFQGYTIALQDNVYLTGKGPTSGSILAINGYKALAAGQIYGKALLENNQGYAGYVSEVLEVGATEMTEQELKQEEIWYD